MWWTKYDDGGLGRPREDGPLPPVGPWMQAIGTNGWFLGGFRALWAWGDGLGVRPAPRRAEGPGEQGPRA